MIATRITYGVRITGDHPRWCAICGTQRSTTRGVFDLHTKPDGKPCPNSGQRVNKVEQAG